MAKSFHELAPRGDVVFVLKCTNDQSPRDDATAAGDAAASKKTTISEDPPLSCSGSQEIRIRASSEHLRLASPYFDKMLGGSWLEGNTLTTNGSVEVRLENDEDPAALLVLLNIIHGHTRKIPRSVDREMLTKFAVLVDYYDCHEAVEVFSDMWIVGLNKTLPNIYSKELVQWIFISWVFNKAIPFRSMTWIAQSQSKGPLETYGLPIPSTIVGQYSMN
jgi:hypothetical protein